MFFSEDVEIIRELITERKVDLYNLHLKYRLSPAQVSRSVNNLLKENVIAIEGDFIFLTEKSREWILKNRKELFLDKNRKYWKTENVDYKYKGDELRAFEFVADILKIIEEDEE